MIELMQEKLDEMRAIPAGEFWMGSDDGDTEGPIHKVHLDDFWMDETPVTNGQFARFALETGYRTTAEESGNPGWHQFANEDRRDHPVVLVTWWDAAAYAEWARKRLPTEAEWEKAARGGLSGKLFPWGDTAPGIGRANWNALQISRSILPTTPVRHFPANGFGLHDMCGNVWQWCRDWYDDEYYAQRPDANPTGPDEGTYRVRRGASWNVREDFRLRCANRGAMPPESFHPNLGFRCAI